MLSLVAFAAKSAAEMEADQFNIDKFIAGVQTTNDSYLNPGDSA